MVKWEDNAFSETTNMNTNSWSQTLKDSKIKSVYPSMINLSSPFVISKMNMTQMLYKAKIKQERKNFINPSTIK